MPNDPLGGAPKPGAFVQSHVPQILDYIATVDREEFLQLQRRAYSSEQFRLSYPFFKSVEQIEADGDKRHFYVAEYVVQGQQVRVCSQWTARHRPFVLSYLVERQIPVIGVSAELREEWLAVAELAGTTSTSPGGARYRSTPIGVAQNAFVRHLLSNLGYEQFAETDWLAVKGSFGNACVYCGGEGTLQMDHAMPLSRLQLGEHRLGNLVPACPTCNGKKSHLRFRPYLEAKYAHDRDEAQVRIAEIEAHMAGRSYLPLEDRQDISELIEQARREIAEIAVRYLDLINSALDDRVPGPNRSVVGHEAPGV